MLIHWGTADDARAPHIAFDEGHHGGRLWRWKKTPPSPAGQTILQLATLPRTSPLRQRDKRIFFSQAHFARQQLPSRASSLVGSG